MDGKNEQKQCEVRMGKLRSWFCFKQRVVFSTKRVLLKFTSRARHKARGNNQGFRNLYKDMESCREYTDIQVMWEMIQSSCHPSSRNTTKSKTYSWKSCFRPN